MYLYIELIYHMSINNAESNEINLEFLYRDKEFQDFSKCREFRKDLNGNAFNLTKMSIAKSTTFNLLTM